MEVASILPRWQCTRAKCIRICEKSARVRPVLVVIACSLIVTRSFWNFARWGNLNSAFTRTTLQYYDSGSREYDGRSQFNQVDSVPTLSISKWNSAKRSKVEGPVREAVDLTWYQYTNICVNKDDYFKYTPESSSNVSQQLSSKNLDSVTVPYRSIPLDVAVDDVGSVVLLEGVTILVQCWRSKRRPNPSHFMFAYGKLYALLNDGLPNMKADNVVFFQCADPFSHGDEKGFFNTIWSIVLSSGVKKGWLDPTTKYFTTPLSEHRDLNFCISSALVDHSVGFVLGRNHEATINAWKQDTSTFIKKRTTTNGHVEVKQSLSQDTVTDSCSVIPCIAIFQRKEGSHLRLFDNLAEVIDLSKSFSTCVQMITLTSNSSVAEAFDLFNSFDVLITPHGSHLTNGILIRKETPFMPAIIEMMATCYNDDWKKNLRKFTSYYSISTGHEVTSRNLQVKLHPCRARTVCAPTEDCPIGLLKTAVQSNFKVNITKLRIELKLALDKRAAQLKAANISC